MEADNPFLTLHKGTSVLLNVFHRADSNGDGMVSKDEFLDFFWDGVATQEELTQLFEEINAHNTGTVDASELCSFVWRYLGPFSAVLAAIEDLNSSTTTACCQTEEAYNNLTTTEQFVTRLMLREAKFQLSKVQQLIDDCAAKIDKENIPLMDSETIFPPIRCGRLFPPCPMVKPPVKMKKQVVTQTSINLEENSQDLSYQIKKLGKLVRQIENQPVLRKVTETQVDSDCSDCNMLFLVQHSIPVEGEAVEGFKKNIVEYTDECRGLPGCEQVDTLWYKDITTFVIYELWDKEDSWIQHASSPLYRTFQHHIVDSLRKPEQFSTMEIPSSWLHEL